MRYILQTLAVACLLVALPSVGAAQDDGRLLFELGQAAHAEGRFAEARDHLRASLEHSPRVATAFNLGLALRGTGETLGALSIFNSLLAGEFGEVSDGARADAEVLLGELRGEIAVVHVHFPRAPRARLFINGRSQGIVADGARLELNPGSHTFVAETQGRRSDRVRVELSRGSDQVVTLTLPANTGTLVLEAETGEVEIVGVERAPLTLTRQLAVSDYDVVWWNGDDADRRSVSVVMNEETRVHFESNRKRRRRWILAILGVAIAGAAVGVYFATRPGDPELPTNDDVFGVIRALSAP